MHRTYRYRLYPTVEQSHVLDLLLWQGRRMYNAALTQRIATYQQTGKGPSYVDQCAYFKEQRTGFSEIYGLLNASSVQQMLRRLAKSFTAFFRRLKQGHKPGFPRFKARNRFHSLEYRHGDGCKLKYDRQQSRFYVQNVGDIKVKYHRPLPEEAQLGHVVIKQSLGRCYVCLLVELPSPKPVEHSGPTVGIDIGLKSLLALSDGTRVDNPRWLRQSLGKLRIAQRRLARRKRGRNRRRKAAVQVARCGSWTVSATARLQSGRCW